MPTGGRLRKVNIRNAAKMHARAGNGINNNAIFSVAGRPFSASIARLGGDGDKT